MQGAQANLHSVRNLRIELYVKTANFQVLRQDMTGRATWCIPRGVSSVIVLARALSGASRKTLTEVAPRFLLSAMWRALGEAGKGDCRNVRSDLQAYR